MFEESNSVCGGHTCMDQQGDWGMEQELGLA